MQHKVLPYLFAAATHHVAILLNLLQELYSAHINKQCPSAIIHCRYLQTGHTIIPKRSSTLLVFTGTKISCFFPYPTDRKPRHQTTYSQPLNQPMVCETGGSPTDTLSSAHTIAPCHNFKRADSKPDF